MCDKFEMPDIATMNLLLRIKNFADGPDHRGQAYLLTVEDAKKLAALIHPDALMYANFPAFVMDSEGNITRF